MSTKFFEKHCWDWDQIRTEFEARNFTPYKIKKEHDSFIRLKAELNSIDLNKIISPLFNEHYNAINKQTLITK